MVARQEAGQEAECQEAVACQEVAAVVARQEARQEVEVQEVELRQEVEGVGLLREYSNILSTLHSDLGS